jgi:DNA-binding transcriptional regulator YdaS (Cro superfamily)
MMTEEQAFAKVKEQLGGNQGIAERLGDLTRQAVAQWDRVPPKRVLQIEALTGISRHELRPDVFGARRAGERSMSPDALVRRLLRLLHAAEHPVEQVPQIGGASNGEPQSGVDVHNGVAVRVEPYAAEAKADRLVEHASLSANVSADRLNVEGVVQFEKAVPERNAASARVGLIAHVHPSLLNIQSAVSFLQESRPTPSHNPEGQDAGVRA